MIRFVSTQRLPKSPNEMADEFSDSNEMLQWISGMESWWKVETSWQAWPGQQRLTTQSAQRLVARGTTLGDDGWHFSHDMRPEIFGVQVFRHKDPCMGNVPYIYTTINQKCWWIVRNVQRVKSQRFHMEQNSPQKGHGVVGWFPAWKLPGLPCRLNSPSLSYYTEEQVRLRKRWKIGGCKLEKTCCRCDVSWWFFRVPGIPRFFDCGTVMLLTIRLL